VRCFAVLSILRPLPVPDAEACCRPRSMPPWLGAGLMAALVIHAGPLAAQEATQLGVAAAVAGIIGHVRWPGMPRPRQLCVSTASAQATALNTLHEALPAGRLRPVRALPPDSDLPDHCDVIYLGAGMEAQAALPRLAGLPVVTIGEGAAFCSRGGMFCLVPRSRTPGMRLELNLDIVARSGLKVDPQVLRLGRTRDDRGRP